MTKQEEKTVEIGGILIEDGYTGRLRKRVFYCGKTIKIKKIAEDGSSLTAIIESSDEK